MIACLARLRAFGPVLAVLVAAGCAGPTIPEISPPTWMKQTAVPDGAMRGRTTGRAETPAVPCPADDPYCGSLYQCEARGGSPSYGPWGEHYCEIRFDDAGKVCTSGQQCKGGCVNYGDRQARGTAASGQCAESNLLFSCFGVIEDGIYQGTICVD